MFSIFLVSFVGVAVALFSNTDFDDENRLRFLLSRQNVNLCQGNQGDSFCQSRRPGSYCKYWQKDQNGESVCHGLDATVKCSCSDGLPDQCSEINQHKFCEGHQSGSYCKFWQHVQVCQHTDIPCSCQDILESSTTTSSSSSTTTTTAPTTTTTTTTTAPTTTTTTTTTTVPSTTTTTTTSSQTTTETPTVHPPPQSLPQVSPNFNFGLYNKFENPTSDLFISFLVDPNNYINGDIYITTTNSNLYISFIEKLQLKIQTINAVSLKTFGRIYFTFESSDPNLDTSVLIGIIDNLFDTLTTAIFFDKKQLGPIGILFDLPSMSNERLSTVLNYASLLLRDNFPDFKIGMILGEEFASENLSSFFIDRGNLIEEVSDQLIFKGYRNFVDDGNGGDGIEDLLEKLFTNFPKMVTKMTEMVTVNGPADDGGEYCRLKETYSTEFAFSSNIHTFGRPDQIFRDFETVRGSGVGAELFSGAEFSVDQYRMFRCFFWDFVARNFNYDDVVQKIYGVSYSSYQDLVDEHCPAEYYRSCDL